MELHVFLRHANDVGSRSRELPAIGAVADMSVWLLEEILLRQGEFDGAADAGACQAFFVEFVGRVVVWVAC